MPRKLKVAPPAPFRKPPKARIEALEEILAELKAGKISGLAFVAKNDGYCTWFGWWAPKRMDAVNILGQLQLVQRDIVAAERDDYTD